jgi:hypothetical protein
MSDLEICFGESSERDVVVLKAEKGASGTDSWQHYRLQYRESARHEAFIILNEWTRRPDLHFTTDDAAACSDAILNHTEPTVHRFGDYFPRKRFKL